MTTLDLRAPARTQWFALVDALRIHQWVKNLLVFVPLLASHQYGSQQSVTHAVLAAIAFSDGVGRLPAE